ncbi:hypothetical protein [Bradyrhizobium sp. C9]|uniref:hypothetical protein n=1 Tax=Bradyrhizobium sp. C9 TaxID=142585 RepID=UPI0011783578|nr:hypothetical protein [Bradyrhizobium sp. C9]
MTIDIDMDFFAPEGPMIGSTQSWLDLMGRPLGRPPQTSNTGPGAVAGGRSVLFHGCLAACRNAVQHRIERRFLQFAGPRFLHHAAQRVRYLLGERDQRDV